MTVAELLRDLAHEVVKGRGKWEINVSILKTNPTEDESLRHFGHSQGISGNTEHKRIYVLGTERALEKGEL